MLFGKKKEKKNEKDINKALMDQNEKFMQKIREIQNQTCYN